MKSFYLNVKDRVSVENNAVLILYILCKTLLVVKLDLCKSVKNVLVVLEYSKLRKLSGILEEAVAYLLAKKICDTIGMDKIFFQNSQRRSVRPSLD